MFTSSNNRSVRLTHTTQITLLLYTEPATATSTSEEGTSVEVTAENALPCGDAVFKLSISIAFPLAVLFLAALLGCLLIRNTQQKRKIKQLQKALET